MKRTIVVASAGLLVLGFLGLAAYFEYNREDTSDPPADPGASRSTALVDGDVSEPGMRTDDDLPGKVVTAVTTRTPQELLGRSAAGGSKLLDTTLKPYDLAKLPKSDVMRYSGATSRLDARSPEEAQWLREHGYPSELELGLVHSGHGDLQALAESAAQGDITALGLLGAAQLQRGEFEAGYANLEEAAARGSVYALIEIGMDYSRSQNPERMIQALALHNLAVMRGDYRAMEYGFVVRRSKPDMAFRAQVLAMRYWQNLNAYRVSLGLPPFANAMRPGFDVEQPTGSTQVPIFAHRGG